jgi:hypothetical protein
MWFRPVNEMIELVSGIPAPQFGDYSYWVRGSELVQGSSGSCISFWLMYGVFTYPLKYLRVHQVEDHWSSGNVPTSLTTLHFDIVQGSLQSRVFMSGVICVCSVAILWNSLWILRIPFCLSGRPDGKDINSVGSLI